MGLELYEMIGAMSTDKSGDVLMDVTLGWDTNEELIKFADKWKKEYSKLTDLERRAATYVFFNGVFRYSLDPQGKRRYDKKGIVKYSRVINPEYFPPISDNPLETTLLHPDVASIFFKKYNDNLHSRIIKEKAVKKQFDKKPTGRGILQDITLVDKTINKEC